VPRLLKSVLGLTVDGLGGSRLTAAPESSRRTAASCTQAVGGSTGGAVGAFPANGLNSSLITLARTVEIVGGGVAVLGAAGCTATNAGVLWALDSVEAVAAVAGTTTLGVEGEAFVGGVLTTWLAATVPLSVAAEEADEFAVTPVDVDDDRPDSDVLCLGVTSEPVVWPVVVRIGVGAASALAPDDAADTGCVAALGVDDWPRPAPVLPEIFEPLFAPPVLTTTPGAAEVVDPVDVDADVEPDPVDVLVPVDEPAEVFADPEPEPFADEPDEFDEVEDDPPEAGAAQATP
jgi:hypothetical protein